MARVLRACLIVAFLGALTWPSLSAPLVSWELNERFGVSHPDQIVYLDLPAGVKAENAALLDAGGRPVPFQVMANGQLAVRTDLPAGERRAFSLQAGRPVPCPQPVVVTPGTGYTELTNGLIGLRVPQVPADLTNTPSPIQGLRYRDGTWCAVGPNYMDRPAKSMTVEWLEKGALVTRVRISYVYDRALLRSARPEVPEVPAGEGPYSVTIEMQAGQYSILFEEDCEVDISYRVDITDGLNPTRAQYRGHHANSVEAGREEDGRVYKYENFGNRRHDALVDLDYDRDPEKKDRWSRTTYPFMSHWDPWSVNTGFYWQLYSTLPAAPDNLFGIFAGPASRLLRPGLSGVSIDTRTVDGMKRALLQVRFQRLMPTQYYSTHMRFGWGIYLGKKSEDVKPLLEVQGINRQMNLHAGVNLNTLYRLPADFPDPPAGYGGLYVKPEVARRLATELQAEAGRGEKTLYNTMYNQDPYSQDILDLWRTPSAEAAAKAARTVTDFAAFYLETLVNGEGIYQHQTHYFMGCLQISAHMLRSDQILGSGLLAPVDRQRLKQAVALFGTLLWNNDLAPMQEDSGMNYGPANMWSMWMGTRYSYTAFLAQHPLLRPHVDEVKQATIRQIHDYVNEAGACTASAHYTGASMSPILNLIQQLQMARVADLCATESVLKRYAEWEMQLMTPPEARFGGLRKIIAVGDGSTEFSTRPGQLGTAFAASDPALSARLIGAWRSMGSPHNSFFGTTYLKIDPSLPAESPRLGSAQFRGWMSVLRSGWETPEESAVFFVNGDTLSDHRHNDNGALVIYALGAPLSLDWGPIYYPRVAGGMMHSLVLPESAVDRTWTADNTSLDLPAGPGGQASWWRTEHAPLLAFTQSASACATFRWFAKPDLRWSRTVRLLHPDLAAPVILIEDALSTPDGPPDPLISTLNLMAQGSVETPAGLLTPVERFYDRQDKNRQELPSAGTPAPLPQGLSRLRFTGQWGVDCDLYIDCATPVEFALGNWANNWHPSTETGQFQRAVGRPFEERQHILRLRSTAPTRMILLPYRQGQRPDPCSVERVDDLTIIRLGDLTLSLADNWYSARLGDRVSLTYWGPANAGAEAEGMRLGGGPMEVVLEGETGTLTSLYGKVADRLVALPAGWKIAEGQGEKVKQEAPLVTIKLVRAK